MIRILKDGAAIGRVETIDLQGDLDVVIDREVARISATIPVPTPDPYGGSYMTSPQTIGGGAGPDIIAFDDARENQHVDGRGFTVSTYRWEAPREGNYQVALVLYMAGTNNGLRARLNNDIDGGVFYTTYFAVNVDELIVTIVRNFWLNAGSALMFQMTELSGAGDISIGYDSSFSVSYLGPA